MPSVNPGPATSGSQSNTAPVSGQYDSNGNLLSIVGWSQSTAPGTIPPYPTGILAYAGNTTATISWNAVPNATAYRVSASLSSQSVIVQSTGTVTQSVMIAGLTNGTQYTFLVSAFLGNNEVINPASSNAVTPTNPSAVDGAFPTTIPNPIGWWIADSLGLANTNPVNTWNDSSGNGFNAVKSGTAPTFVTSWANGNNKNAVLFSAGNFITTLTAASMPAQMTVFAVADITGAGNYQLLSNTAVNGVNAANDIFVDTNAGNLRISICGDTLSGGPAQAQNAAFVLSLNMPGSAFNKGTKFTGQPFSIFAPPGSAYPASLTQGLVIGGHPLASKNWTGNIAQVAVFPFLTTAQRQAFEAYLGTKYNITMTQASNP